MSKHTPGPWAVSEFKKIVSYNSAVMAGGVGHYEHVATIESQPETEIEDANAALIATAPQLLELLESILKTGYVTESSQRLANDVIARARGD